MRKNWMIAIALWAGLMLLGWGVWASRIEESLETAAREALRTHVEARRLTGVTVDFDGQEAVLGGKVHQAAMRGLAAQIVGQELRRPTGLGAALNPVTYVRNEITVEPLPTGWLLLACLGKTIHLQGRTGSEAESATVVREILRVLARPGMELRRDLRADVERTSEAEQLEATLESLRRRAGEAEGKVLLARAGGEWQSFSPGAQGAIGETLAALGTNETEREERVAPLLRVAEAYSEQQRLAAAERERLAKLPLPHVLAAFSGKRVVLRGEVGTAEFKSQLIAEALKAYPGRQVLDEVRVSTERRPEVDFRSLLAAFPAPPTTAKERLAAVGVPGSGWNIVKADSKGLTAAIAAALPAGLEARLVAADATALASWLQEEAASAAERRPYLALAVFADRVWLRGEVAEESARTQILDGARRSYPNHLLVHYVRLNAECLPIENPLQTAKSFPIAPDKNAPGLVAFVIAGQVWNSAPAEPGIFALGGIAKSGLLPADFPAAVAVEEFAEALEALQAHLGTLKKPEAN